MEIPIMGKFRVTITAPTTVSAVVEVEADSIEEAHAMALAPSFFNDPEKATFHPDDDNVLREVYLPDENDYEQIDAPQP